jgi:hypothetical protein
MAIYMALDQSERMTSVSSHGGLPVTSIQRKRSSHSRDASERTTWTCLLEWDLVQTNLPTHESFWIKTISREAAALPSSRAANTASNLGTQYRRDFGVGARSDIKVKEGSIPGASAYTEQLIQNHGCQMYLSSSNYDTHVQKQATEASHSLGST